ncbi:hypothetical protein ACCS78_15400, partial [Rhizobium johnstonii]
METISPIEHLSVRSGLPSSAFFAVQRPAMCIRLLQFLHFCPLSGKKVALEIGDTATISGARQEHFRARDG